MGSPIGPRATFWVAGLPAVWQANSAGVSANALSCATCLPSRGTLLTLHAQRAFSGLLSVNMHALVSPLYYTLHHSCALLTTSFTHNTFLTWPSFWARSLLPKCQRSLLLKESEYSLPTKIPFLKISRNLTLSINYYSTPHRDEW